MRVSLRGRAAGIPPSLDRADRDTKVRRPLPDPPDIPDGQASFRGWRPGFVSRDPADLHGRCHRLRWQR